MNKKPFIVLTGPTAVGKSALSIELAKKIGGEIISADSMQVYKKMNIGSAKITTPEMDGVPHHLIDILEPWEEFNVAMFQKLCKAAMEEIYSRGKIPILVGGTGFYIQSVLYDISFCEIEVDKQYREELEGLVMEHGAGYVHTLLKEVDEASAECIHENNTKKVIRALEYYKQTGQPISQHNEMERQKNSPYNFAYFVLNTDRNILYKKIEQRVDQMVENGLVDEVKDLLDSGCTKDMVSMQGLGYKEIIGYLMDEITLEESVYLIKRDTRHFAKRQLTWFRREKEVIWLEKQSKTEQDLLEEISLILKEKEVIHE